MICEPIWLCIWQNESIRMTLVEKWDCSLYGYMFDKYEGWACLSMSLDAKHDIWTYLVLNSVNIKYWDDPCCEKEILAYMVANLKNGMVEFVLDLKHDFWTYLVLYLVKWKYWNDPCRENEILAYMVANLINGKVEFVPWFKAWFVNIFGFVFGKMKVLKCLLSRKWDFVLYTYKLEKKEG